MPDLTLRRVHDDEEHLVLQDEQGTEYLLPIDESLYAAVRRDKARLAKLHVAEEQVRPKDIQAMIRSGLAADEVAEQTGAPIEHIRRFERPVLAERAHVAERAGAALVYPENDPDATPRPLLELCRERLVMRDVDLSTMEWDAWRRPDGQWYVECTFKAGNRSRHAGWNFHRGSISPVDDEARWLSDAGPTDSGPIPSYGSGAERVFNIEAEERRAAAHEEHRGGDHQAETGRILESLRRRRGRHNAEDLPAQVEPDEEPVSQHGVLRAVEVDRADPDQMPGAHVARPEDATEAEVFALPRREDSPAPKQEQSGATLDDQPSFFDDDDFSAARYDTQPVDGLNRPDPAQGKRQKRSSVPSWDEIMFGGKKD